MNSISKYRAVMCDSCDVVVINNIICHETGCPDAWKDETRRCKWCGRRFKPVEKNQEFCGSDCAESFNS
jgi:hypothetical protein